MQWLYTDEDVIRILSDCRGVPPTEIGRLQLEKENLLNPVVNKAITLALEKTDGAVPPVNENLRVYGYLFPLACRNSAMTRSARRKRQMNSWYI